MPSQSWLVDGHSAAAASPHFAPSTRSKVSSLLGLKKCGVLRFVMRRTSQDLQQFEWLDHCCANWKTNACKESAWAPQLFYNALRCHFGCQLRIREHEWTSCAADAFATEHEAGIGGWWIPDGLESIPANARRFCFQFTTAQLPRWFSSPGSSSLQSCIAAFSLAQLVLLLLRCDELPQHESFVLRFAQLTDNRSVSHAAFGMLSMKQPLSYALQALGLYSCQLGVSLTCSHVADVRNVWADALSHNAAPPGFLPQNQRSLQPG